MGMMLDVWTSHVIETNIVSGVGSFEISGYSFTCVPLPMLTVDEPDRRRVVVPAGFTYLDFLGKNKWIALSLWMDEHRGLGDRSVEFIRDARGDWGVIVAGFSDLRFAPGADANGSASATPGELGCRDEGDPSAWSDYIDRPAGTWQPCAALWSLEPDDARVVSRDTASPYHPEHRTVITWGTEYTSTLLVDLVPAADIFAMRAADIPFSGWAAKAARTPARGTGSTLEYLLPRIFASEPQIAELTTLPPIGRPGWLIEDPGYAPARWTPQFGRPVVLYLSGDLIGKGYAMRGKGYYGGPFDDGYTPYTEHLRMTWDDSVARHVVIPAGTSLASMLTVRVGTNRMYRVEIPLIDVTWPSRTPGDGGGVAAYQTQRMAR